MIEGAVAKGENSESRHLLSYTIVMVVRSSWLPVSSLQQAPRAFEVLDFYSILVTTRKSRTPIPPIPRELLMEYVTHVTQGNDIDHSRSPLALARGGKGFGNRG